MVAHQDRNAVRLGGNLRGTPSRHGMLADVEFTDLDLAYVQIFGHHPDFPILAAIGGPLPMAEAPSAPSPN